MLSSSAFSHRCDRLPDRIAPTIEELDVYILAPALKRNENAWKIIAIGAGDDSDGLEAAHANHPSVRGESYPARGRQPDANSREAARPDTHRHEVQRGGRQPSLAHCAVHDWQEHLRLPMSALDARRKQHRITDGHYCRAGQAGRVDGKGNGS